MYVIGIDISKYKHDCAILDEDTGTIVRDVFSFDNTRAGFNQFLEVLKTLDPNVKKKIGFESTGHCQANLKIFLENKGLDFMEINALLVHKFKSSQTFRA